MVVRRDNPGEDLRRLSRFRELNPHLLPGQGSHRCRGLWDLLTSRHREDPECCNRGYHGLDLESCFLGRPERWRDTETGLPVVVAHPECWHTEGEDHHGGFQDFFEGRGLAYLVSRGSWHDYAPSLVVVARADVIEGIGMPPGDDGLEPVHYPGWTTPDWEMAEVLKLAEEQLLRDRKARLAEKEEVAGEYEIALRLYCETAYMDRTAGFHNLAGDQLILAKAVVDGCPDLDLSRLYFKNPRDRDFVCGPVPPVLSRGELHRRLRSIELPRGWWRFRSPRGGYALARISGKGPSGEERSGSVSLEQGGPLNYWAVAVEVDGVGEVAPSSRDEPGGHFDGPDFCWPDPESAVRAAVMAWRSLDD